MKKIILIVFIFCLSIFQLQAASFNAGKDYTVINASAEKQNPVQVMEFFNYGCPWCAHAEPQVEAWLKTKPKYVEFSRVPVAFEQGWDTYSKAYYAAQALGIEKKLTPAIFTAIHGKDDTQYHDLSSDKAIIDFFVSQGVKRSTAEGLFTNNATLELKEKQGMAKMKFYKVFAIPAFVIGGKYSVNLGQAKTPQRLMQIVNYLVELAHK